MCEETRCLQLQPGTAGSHPAWPTTPGALMLAPKAEDRRAVDSHLSLRKRSEGTFYLWRRVLQNNCHKSERRWSSNGSVRDEKRPVPVQGPLLHTLHYCKQTVQGSLMHTTVIKSARGKRVGGELYHSDNTFARCGSSF